MSDLLEKVYGQSLSFSALIEFLAVAVHLQVLTFKDDLGTVGYFAPI